VARIRKRRGGVSLTGDDAVGEMGEGRLSDERLASRAYAHPRSLPSSRYFGAPPAQPLRLVLVDPTNST